MYTMGNDLVREARKRAGLTQRELADKAGTTQSAIARLESGRTSVAFDRVIRLIRLCDLDLHVSLVPRDPSDWMQAQKLLKLTPEQRLDHLLRVSRKAEELRRGLRDGAA